MPDDLLRRARMEAARRHCSLTALIAEALGKALSDRAKRIKNTAVNLPTFKGNGVQPGVDLNSTAALLDIMEHRQ